jgi:hypothetical protein
MSTALRHHCRNPHCRSKLTAPVENRHRAFCTKGCYQSFYLNRCRVCERDLRKAGRRGDATRQYCRQPSDCKREAEKWPEKYGGGQSVAFPATKQRKPDFTRLKFGLRGDRPSAHSLSQWWWGDDLSLYDREGLTIARLAREDDRRYQLRTPLTWPHIARSNLKEAKRHAEEIALATLPLVTGVNVQTAELKRIKGANAKPHPMGPALNLPPSTSDANASDWRPSGNGADVPDIPDFLRGRR